MNKVSVHILYNPSFNVHGPNINLIKKLVSKSPYAIPKVVRGIDGHVGQSRALGWGSSDQKYSSYIDDDDTICDVGYFERAVKFLDRNPHVGAYAGRELIEVKSNFTPITESPMFKGEYVSFNELNNLHHLLVIRTDLVKSYIPFISKIRYMSEYALNARLILDRVPIKVENNINYLWRKGVGTTHVSSHIHELNDLINEYFYTFGVRLN